MNHKDLLDAVAASMAARKNDIPTPKEMEEERVEGITEAVKSDEDIEMFTINIPMITGRVYKVDAREINWDEFDKPEIQKQLEDNEGTIRAMVHALIVSDPTNPETDEMVKDFDESLMNLFSNFGIPEPGYDDLMNEMDGRIYTLIATAKKDMLEACVDTNDNIPECDNDDEIAKISNYISENYYDKYQAYTKRITRYNLLLGKCFDALTLINVIAHNAAMHGLATQVFGFTDSLAKVANLNDITEMDNSVDGLITEDRSIYNGRIPGMPDDHVASGLITE